MFPPIPALEDYGLSPTRGFLPDVLPLTRLPDPYYNKWEAIATNLQALILSRRLRGVVDRLPILSTIGLEHDSEWRRAYSLLAFIAHGYIWGGDSPSDRLPPAIAIPLLEVSRRLEVPPVATYAAVCLWNFKPLFADEDVDNLENLATLTTFTGSLDESWFYLLSVAIEARGAPTIPLMLAAIDAARHGDALTVTACLRAFAERLDDLGSLLQRMHENCDPTIFYHRIRPFLAGSKNMAEAGLPNGVIYDDGSGDDTYRQYAGGSNAQSSLIQFFDIVLGVEHRPTGDRRPQDEADSVPTPRHNFIAEMRRYMPGPHARFLNDVSAVSNVRDFVAARPDDAQLRLAYDACLAMLRALRDKHLAIVSRYIVIPSRAERARSRSRSHSPEATRRVMRVNLATASLREARPQDKQPTPNHDNPQHPGADGAKKNNLKGTGGTALMAFLKQARDETSEPAVEDWTRRYMARYHVDKHTTASNDFFLGKETDHEDVDLEQVEVPGLAGLWTMEDEVGGICNY
jgi:indoleamine 2,3-dioxygenase